MAIKLDKIFSAIPNFILDALPFLYLKNLELRILFLILRETYGYHKRRALISTSWFMRCTGVTDAGNVSRAVRGLIGRGIIIRHSSSDFISPSAFQINEEFFKKVIHKNFPGYPKRLSTVPSPQTGEVTSTRTGEVTSTRTGLPPSPQTDIKERPKENNKEILKEILPGLLHNIALKDYNQDQIERLKKECSKQLKLDVHAEAVAVAVKEILLKTDKVRGVKDKFGYSFKSAQNLTKKFSHDH